MLSRSVIISANQKFAKLSKNFAKNKIHVLDNFEEVKPILNDATSDYVFLIENDLPDNYK